MTPAEFETFHEMVGPLVEMMDGRGTFREILKDHLDGKVTVWFVSEGGEPTSMVVVKVRDYHSGLRVMQVQFGAGRMEDFMGFTHECEEFARSQGCHRLQVAGRAGWKRALDRAGVSGWTEVFRTIEKEL